MQLFLAVVEDLYTFVKSILLGTYFTQSNVITIKNNTKSIRKNTVNDREKESNFRSTKDILEETRHIQQAVLSSTEKNIIMYSGGVDVPVSLNPTFSFDSVICKLKYGAMIMVLEQKGRWSKISINDKTGWVLREHLVDRAAYVYPEFIVDEKNFSDDPNTIRLRAMIEDEFACTVFDTPLRSEEYIYYKLMRKNMLFAWSEKHPRIAGRWHEVLRGKKNIYISIQPKENTIMEYVTQEGEGHLAYVEAVFPDNTIKFSEVLSYDEGRYIEEVLGQEQWKELTPVFIEIKNVSYTISI